MSDNNNNNNGNSNGGNNNNNNTNDKKRELPIVPPKERTNLSEGVDGPKQNNSDKK